MCKWILGVVALLLMCGASFADTIGPNCATCGGVVYKLTYAPVGSPVAGKQVYDFTLIVDTSGINVSTAQVLSAVALGVPPGGTNPQLVGQPSVGGWTLMSGGTNSGGCNGSGGFDCAEATATSTGTGTATGVPTGAGDIYTFIFAFTLPAGTTGDLSSGLSLKAVYDTTGGSYGGLQTSDAFASPVPEPSPLALLASGLLVIGMLLKRR
jgi:hypothetical protein